MERFLNRMAMGGLYKLRVLIVVMTGSCKGMWHGYIGLVMVKYLHLCSIHKAATHTVYRCYLPT